MQCLQEAVPHGYLHGGVRNMGKETEIKIQFQPFSNLKFTFAIIKLEIGKKQVSQKLSSSHYNELLFGVLQRG